MKNQTNQLRSLRTFALLVAIIMSIGLWTEARVRAPKIEMGSAVVGRLDTILSRANDLRQALVEKQDSIAITRLRELSIALGEAIKTTDPDEQNKKHMDLILKDAKSAIDRSAMTAGEEKKASLQQAFRQIVLLGQTYKTTDTYKFYFCGKDRSVWPQKTGKPQNPINPETFLNCGVLVQ